MFENKYNSETNTKETEYVPEPEVTGRRKGGAGKFAKVIGIFCLTAAVGFGSVTGYKYFSSREENTDVTANENTKVSVEDITETSAADTEYEVSSLFQLSKKEGSLTTQEVYQKVLPSVVGVTSVFSYNGGGGMTMFGYRGSQESQVKGTGTGIVMSSDGYIITNAHVIYEAEYGGKATEVSILLYNEEEYAADIVSFDTQTDIAVLKVKDAPALTAAEFGDSSTLQVGDAAIAIGNPLGFDLFGTLTVGYISGLNREISMDDAVMHLIQTDAAINNGNSGGPLVNDKGQVIGINSMKLSSSYSSSEATIEGLGFAIPVNEALEIVHDLMNHGYVTGRPQLGITCQDVTVSGTNMAGIRVIGMNENGAAEKAGLQAGDIIVGANGKQIETTSELNQIKNEFKAGDVLKLTVIRENKYVDIEIILEETPAADDEPETSEEAPEENQNPPLPEEPDDSQYGYGYGDDRGNGYGYGFGNGGIFDPFSDFFNFPF